MRDKEWAEKNFLTLHILTLFFIFEIVICFYEEKGEGSIKNLHLLVPGAGIEPARYCYHWCLRPARLPIPPSGRLIIHRCRSAKLVKKSVGANINGCKSQSLTGSSITTYAQWSEAMVSQTTLPLINLHAPAGLTII